MCHHSPGSRSLPFHTCNELQVSSDNEKYFSFSLSLSHLVPLPALALPAFSSRSARIEFCNPPESTRREWSPRTRKLSARSSLRRARSFEARLARSLSGSGGYPSYGSARRIVLVQGLRVSGIASLYVRQGGGQERCLLRAWHASPRAIERCFYARGMHRCSAIQRYRYTGGSAAQRPGYFDFTTHRVKYFCPLAPSSTRRYHALKPIFLLHQFPLLPLTDAYRLLRSAIIVIIDDDTFVIVLSASLN